MHSCVMKNHDMNFLVVIKDVAQHSKLMNRSLWSLTEVDTLKDLFLRDRRFTQTNPTH